VATSAIARRQSIDPGWRRVGLSLVRELSFRDFEEAFAFAPRVANEAVDYLRRPDICVFDFTRVRLTLANPHHAGLSEAKWRLARKVDTILTAEPAAQRAATDGRAWTVPPTRSGASNALGAIVAYDVREEGRPTDLLVVRSGPVRVDLLGRHHSGRCDVRGDARSRGRHAP
jgi:pterin-4a-carbinolamine dehydratase